MADAFNLYPSALDSPALRAVAVTPDDVNPLTVDARGLYVGVGGNVKVVTTGGDTVTFVAVPAGSVLPVRVHQVFATLTTASSIVAIW